MADSPTIVVARLDDKELQESIKSMVTSFNQGLDDMKKHADSVVSAINASLNGIKGGSVSPGGVSDGGSTKRVKAQETEAKAVANTAMTYDNLQSTISKVTQSSEKYTDEIRKQAQAIRDSKEWQEKGRYTFADGTTIYNLETEKKNRVALEQQILDYQHKQAQAALISAASEEKVEQAALRAAMAMHNVNAEAAESNRILRGKGGANESLFQRYGDLRSSVAAVLNVEQSRVNIADIETASTKKLSASLKQLQAAYDNLSAADRNSHQGKELVFNIQQIQREIQKIKTQASRPISLDDVLNLPTKTLDDITYKLRQLQAYKGGLNLETQKNEMREVNKAYDSLRRAQLSYMSDAQKMTGINEALGRSWNYMKNRLAFYFTVGASTLFVKNLIEVRSQYEMNERALGILIDSAERGTKIFNELSQMALVSPYTLIELSSAAKQLTAYDVAAKDVVDTTRRLADMAAAVGVPIERLTYALGQIKAYGYLNSRDNRMFANAGIPLVKQLSDYYTELEGRLVSTADVYDRIKKKQVGYEEVMSVIAQMTDQGGKFYDFQAKMAETMKVQLANLTLAWNNMLNDIGGESQGMFVGGIQALRQLFLHWKDVEHVLEEVAVAYGAFKAYQLVTTKLVGASANALDAHILSLKREQATMLQKEALTRKLTASEANLIATQKTLTATDYQNALSSKSLTKQQAMLLMAMNMKNKALQAAIIRMGLLTQQEIANLTVGKALSVAFAMMGISIKNAAMAMKAFLVSNWWMVLLGGVYELYHAWDSYEEHVAEVNKNAAEHAKEAFENIKQYLESDVISQLRNKVVMTPQGVSDTEGAKAWDEMREKIELSSQASNTFIARLMSIDDINHRLAAGFDYLRDVERVAGVMKTMSDDTIAVSTTILGGLFGEGLKDDLEDFINAYEKYISLNENLRQGGVGEKYFNEQKRALEEFREEVEKTTTSIYDFASQQDFNINEQREFFERMVSETAQSEQLGSKETRIYRMKAEEEYYAYARKKLVEQIQYQQGAQRAATEQRIRELDNEFGTHKDMQQAFFEWVNEKHAHEVRKRFGNMTKEEIAHIDWSQQNWKQWAEKLSKDFSHEYGVSFNELQKLVLQANTWSIHIPVFFQTIGQPLTDIQRDYEARTGKKFADNPLIKDAKSQLEIIDTLKKKQAELAKEIDASEKAGGEYWENNKERMQAENTALIADIHAYNALTDAEEKAQKKTGGGSKKDPVLDALKTEIKLVEQLQGEYDKLTKSSASSDDALATIRGAFGNTIKQLNSQLRGYGLPELTTQLITGKDPNKALAHFKQTLQSLVDKGMMSLERSKEVEAIIEKLTISAKTYNLDKITKGLNSELDKLKEEYELAVELDADPELGNMFTDMFGIDTSDFPKTIDEYMSRAQQEFDKMRKDRDFSAPLNIFKAGDKEWEEWGRQVGLVVDELDENGNVIGKNTDALDKLTPKFKEAQGVAKKWAQDTIKSTTDLEYKLGDLAKKVEMEEAKLAVLEDNAAKETNAAQKHLFELRIQEQKEAIEKLKMESVKLLPFYEDLFGDMYNVSVGRLKEIAKAAKEVMSPRQDDSGVGYTQRTDSKGKVVYDIFAKDKQGEIKKTTISLEEYIKINKQIDSIQQKIAESSPWEKIKDSFSQKESGGLKNFASGMETIGSEMQKVANITKEIGGFAEALGADENTVEIINDIATSIGGVATAAQGIGQIARGDYIGGAVSVVSGLFSTIISWFDNSDKKIVAQIEDSERRVKRLGNAYKIVEYQIEKAVGTGKVGMRQWNVELKKLELAEVERQLQLEESRTSKHRDQDKIIELKGSIIDLRQEIEKSTDEIVNDLLGISSVGDSVESLCSAMIDAFKKGEDYMKEYDESFAEMIDNMIAKSIASKVVGDVLNEVWGELDRKTKERGEQYTKPLFDVRQELTAAQKGEQEAQQCYLNWLKVWQDANTVLSTSGYSFAEKENARQDMIVAEQKMREFAAILQVVGAQLPNLQSQLDQLTTEQEEAMRLTPEDVQDVRDTASEARDKAKKIFEEMMAAYGITFGQDAESAQLSNLQQGISQISEPTANAIEAYLNGVSQQCYLQSSILTKIRDVMVWFDPEVSMGIQSQMLLQLQTQYQLMESMHSLMSGWTNPAGNGIRVEML